ncbi:hypothetical protein QQZ08_001851 [Neonectria magnoliae]|uniref:Amine oxidase domain-containing protein n=1 Tax=Neonectria magnoliae TaxID=2732573 RepID=A0ABR1IDJ3_9HYPO
MSSKVQVTKRLARRGRKTFADIADPLGPWFDGVAYLKKNQSDERFVAASKNKKFGILGGEISGLIAGLMLDSVGVHNWKIFEYSDCIGGRIMTVYLNNTLPEDQYHELGPMRFPDILNEMNAGNDSLQVKFLNWIQ